LLSNLTVEESLRLVPGDVQAARLYTEAGLELTSLSGLSNHSVVVARASTELFMWAPAPLTPPTPWTLHQSASSPPLEIFEEAPVSRPYILTSINPTVRVFPTLFPEHLVTSPATSRPLSMVTRNITITTLKVDPKIFLVDGLLMEEECDYIVEKAQEKKLDRSVVGGDTAENARTTDYRTSTQTWLDIYQDTVLKFLHERVSTLTGVPRVYSEALQVIHYELLQHYFFHHDYFDANDFPNNAYFQAGGNRLFTALFYLTDVEEGGGTVFPITKQDVMTNEESVRCCDAADPFCADAVRVAAKKGRAVLWYNLRDDSRTMDRGTLHAGCDVKAGVKWACNLWFRNLLVKGVAA